MQRDFGMQHLPLYPLRMNMSFPPPLLASEQHYDRCHRLTDFVFWVCFSFEDVVFYKHLSWVVLFGLPFEHGVAAQKRARWNI